MGGSAIRTRKMGRRCDSGPIRKIFHLCTISPYRGFVELYRVLTSRRRAGVEYGGRVYGFLMSVNILCSTTVCEDPEKCGTWDGLGQIGWNEGTVWQDTGGSS